MILTIFFGTLLLFFWPMIGKRQRRKIFVMILFLLAVYELIRTFYHLFIVKI